MPCNQQPDKETVVANVVVVVIGGKCRRIRRRIRRRVRTTVCSACPWRRLARSARFVSPHTATRTRRDYYRIRQEAAAIHVWVGAPNFQVAVGLATKIRYYDARQPHTTTRGRENDRLARLSTNIRRTVTVNAFAARETTS